jgi:hypothetical protein
MYISRQWRIEQTLFELFNDTFLAAWVVLHGIFKRENYVCKRISEEKLAIVLYTSIYLEYLSKNTKHFSEFSLLRPRFETGNSCEISDSHGVEDDCVVLLSDAVQMYILKPKV